MFKPKDKNIGERSAVAKTNTDTVESRVKRAMNQYDFEQNHLSETFGKPFKERFFQSRLALFKGFSNVDGEDPVKLALQGKIVSDNRDLIEIHDQFPPSTLAVEQSMAVFEGNIDRWYRQLREMKSGESKQLAVQRFVALLYVAGVSMQPTTDGNKQTFKILCQSYLHDLLPETREMFFPEQQTDDLSTPMKEVGTAFFGGGLVPDNVDLTSVEIPHFEAVNPEEQSIMDALVLARKISRRLGDAAEGKNKETVLAVADALAHETGNMAFKEIRKISKNSWEAVTYLRIAAENRIRDIGLHDPWEIHPTIYGGGGQKIERASWAVKQLWGSPEGVEFSEKYILNGESRMDKGENQKDLLFWKASNALENQRKHMFVIMEGRGEHDERHRKMVEKYVELV